MVPLAHDDDAGAGARFRNEDPNVRRRKETQPAQRKYIVGGDEGYDSLGGEWFVCSSSNRCVVASGGRSTLATPVSLIGKCTSPTHE